MFGKIHSINNDGVLSPEARSRAWEAADHLSRLKVPNLDMIKVIADKEASLGTGVPIGNLISGRISHFAQLRDNKPFYWAEDPSLFDKFSAEFKAQTDGRFNIDSFTIESGLFNTRAMIAYTLCLDGTLKKGLSSEQLEESMIGLKSASLRGDFPEFANLVQKLLDIDGNDLLALNRKVGHIYVAGK